MPSKRNLKLIKSLKVKKYRELEGLFLVEGTKNVLEALRSGLEVEQILCTKNFINKYDHVLEGLELEIVLPKTLREVGTFAANADVVAVVRMSPESGNIDFAKHIFCLDGIKDPGNLGTILRTLDWFGIDQLVCSPDSVDFYNPKVIAGSMGSFTRIQPRYKDLPSFLSEYPKVTFAADMAGESLDSVKLNDPCCVVMGSESHGISSDLRPFIDKQITIPGFGSAESLNVGIATGIIAYQLINSK